VMKKLLIIVGAGASIEFGLPSVNGVDQLMDQRASKYFPLVSDPSSNLYRHVRDSINAYYAANVKPALAKAANFEEVLYQLNLLGHYLSDPHRIFGSKALLTANPLPDIHHFNRNLRAVDGDVTRQLALEMVDAIVEEVIAKSASAHTTKSSEIRRLQNFLDALSAEFDIGVVTLNYDDIFEQARPDLFTGFDASGHFNPMSVFARSNWNFIYHPHGSIHFGMTGTPHDMHAITWDPSPSASHTSSSSGRSTQDSMEGIDFPTSPIIAGYGKTTQSLRQPFRTYFAQTNRLVHEADGLLFLGYGFGDFHLNMALSEVRNRPRPTVVVDWAPDNQDPLHLRMDSWAVNLCRTLPVNATSMVARGTSAPADIKELKATNEFEVSDNPSLPLAVWYGGFLNACDHPAKVIANLS